MSPSPMVIQALAAPGEPDVSGEAATSMQAAGPSMPIVCRDRVGTG